MEITAKQYVDVILDEEDIKKIISSNSDKQPPKFMIQCLKASYLSSLRLQAYTHIVDGKWVEYPYHGDRHGDIGRIVRDAFPWEIEAWNALEKFSDIVFGKV